MLTLQNGRRARDVLALGALTFVLGIAAVACDEFLKPRRYNGPTGNPFPDGGVSDAGDGGPYDPFACVACLQPMCTVQQTYCNQSDTCVTLQQLVNGNCNDFDLVCSQAYINQAAGDPAGQQLYINLANCERNYACSSCRDECQPPASYCR
ncbi:hypothetical protein LVJ94_14710 [Pendulispora rubella]|uniref:Uncharacterized protein n=1 Tax=Pendulispora rubella TaxID=2741070 RepID=A0ABZ2LC44_9BACT